MTSVSINQTNRYIFSLLNTNTNDINYANKTLSLCTVCIHGCQVLRYLVH